MTPTELIDIMERNRISPSLLSYVLGLTSERAIWRWRSGKQDIPEGVAATILALEDAIAGVVANNQKPE